MFEKIILSLTLCFIIFSIVIPMNETKIGPKGFDQNDTTTCEQFSKFARFNPYSVLNDTWMVFYYWAPYKTPMAYKFIVPTAEYDEFLHYFLDNRVSVPVNWTARRVLMTDNDNATSMLVERGDRGEYWLYMLLRNLPKGKKIDPVDIRFKQTGDNKYIGFMLCKHQSAYLMSRLREVPPKKIMPDIIARLGFRSRGGKSYLYQGHHWMPVPEADDIDFWLHPKYKKRFMYQ